MNSDVLISFIVPVYNAESTLSRCLQSILNQTIKEFEIIVVNDGSTDYSQGVIDKFAEIHPAFIKAYIKPNGGPGDTRNFGVQKASGRYIAFVDSDDFIEPNYYSVVKAIIDEHNPDMVIISYNRIWDKKRSFLESVYKFSRWNNFNRPVYVSESPELLCKVEVSACIKIVKREMFLKDDFMFFTHFRIAEDLEASLKWFLKVDKIIVTEKKIYNYIITNNTLAFSSNNVVQFTKVIEEACSYYKKEGKFEKCYPELEYLFAKHMLISNMVRLRMAKLERKYEILMQLRSALMQHFPHYYKNRFLKEEPFYFRVAIYVSRYFPALFKIVL